MSTTEPALSEHLPERFDRRPQPLRVLLGKVIGTPSVFAAPHQPDAALDHPVLAETADEQLVLDVDDEELRLVAGEEHGGLMCDGILWHRSA